MLKTTSWESQIDGKTYSFSYERVKGKHVLTINGQPTTIKPGFLSTMIGFDEGFTLDGHPARLVIEKNRPDIVVDDVYLQSGRQYVHRPAWSLVFAVLCLLIPIVSMGGALPILFGIGGAAACISVSKNSMPTVARVFLCTVITIAAWAVWVVLLLLIGAMG